MKEKTIENLGLDTGDEYLKKFELGLLNNVLEEKEDEEEKAKKIKDIKENI